MAPQRQAASARNVAAGDRPIGTRVARKTGAAFAAAGPATGATGTPEAQPVATQKSWDRSVAGASNPKIVQLKEMGFTEDVAKQALAACAWDVNKALDDLLTGRFVPRSESVDADSGSAKVAAGLPSATAGLHSASASTVSSPRSSSQAEKGACASAEALVQDLHNVDSPVSEHPERSGTADLAASPATNSLAEPSSAVDSPVAAQAGSEVAPANPKKLERVAVDWPTDTAGQLSVTAGEFLRTWVDTQTEIGWIYAERVLEQQEQEQLEKSGSSSGGWIAVSALEPPLPKEQRWMVVRQGPSTEHDTQLSVAAGAVLKVNVESKTPEGWVYAEAASGNRRSNCTSEAKEGWVPVFCLDWPHEGHN